MHASFAVTLKGTNVRKTKWLQCFLILRENKEDSAAPHNEKLLKWKTIVLPTQSVKFQTIALWAHKVIKTDCHPRIDHIVICQGKSHNMLLVYNTWFTGANNSYGHKWWVF